VWEDFFEEMKRFRREMNRLFDTFLGSEFEERLLPSLSGLKKEVQLFRQPLSDLKETDKELIAYIEIPGVDKKDIQLKVTENSLEVKAEKKAEAKVEKEGYLKAERSYKGFYRSISLPTKIIPEKTKASYKDGVLEIVMPKAEEKKLEKAKKIEVE
jgi:HSP20 family protein